jgi:hypothetical protein
VGPAGQEGGIVTGWLLQLVVVMAVIAFVGFETISIAITTISLDDAAREVAGEARDAYRSGNELRRAEEAAADAADELEVELVSVEIEGDDLFATVRDEASTLLVHRIGALDTVTRPTARGRARWRP